MKKFIALIVAFLLVGLASVTPAQAAVPLACRTTFVNYVQKRANIKIVSNRPIYYGQTSLKATYVRSDKKFGVVLMDEGYGAVISPVRPATSRGWHLFETWHAGTKCKSLYAPGGTP